MIDLGATPHVPTPARGEEVVVRGRLVAFDAREGRVQYARGLVDFSWAEGAPDRDPLPLGSFVELFGRWNGDGIDASSWRLLTAPDGPFPRAGGDYLWFHEENGRRYRILHVRARLQSALRRYFAEEGFLEVETPIAIPGPALDLHLDSFELPGHRRPRWLSTSPEFQMKRLLAAGFERIYQLGRCFRRGELGPRHQPEFTMLEWYRAFAGSEEVMRDTERLVHESLVAAIGAPEIQGSEGRISLAPPWERLSVAEAFRRYAGVDVSAVLPDEERFFRILVEAVEPRLGVARPVFLVGWPASMASLARLDPKDPTLADRFEAYVDGIELCNGFGELTCPIEQRSRFERDRQLRTASGRPVPPIDEKFLRALAEGMPPSGGNALGFDRLVMLAVGTRRIDDVVAFSDERL